MQTTMFSDRTAKIFAALRNIDPAASTSKNIHTFITCKANISNITNFVDYICVRLVFLFSTDICILFFIVGYTCNEVTSKNSENKRGVNRFQEVSTKNKEPCPHGEHGERDAEETHTKPREMNGQDISNTTDNSNLCRNDDSESADEMLESADDDDNVADPDFESGSEPSSDSVQGGDRSNIPHIVADFDPFKENEDIPKYTGRPRKGRKRKFGEQTRASRKINRNSNEPYYDYRGRKIEKKAFLDFDCKCKMNCAQQVTTETRKVEFERFWSLQSYNSQTNFIAACISEEQKKRSYGNNPNKRKFTRVYKLDNQTVCREMYVKSLGITTFRVDTALKKFHGRAPLTDQRGKKQGGRNKLSTEREEEVIKQIDRIPKYISHYCRNSTEAKFLPPGTTLPKMYKMYREESSQPVSLSAYKKYFMRNLI